MPRVMSAWCGSERPFSYTRRARLRAWMQWALRETAETREAVKCVRQLLEGSNYYELHEPLASSEIYRPYLEQHRILTRSEKKYLSQRRRDARAQL